MKHSPAFYQCNEGACILQVVQGKEAELQKHLEGTFHKLDAVMTEGAGEKHKPVAECNGNTVTVKIGSVAHPMTEEHSISWVYLETKMGAQTIVLEETGEPEAKFILTDGDKAIAAYAYCNLHGLWKTDL